MCGPPRRSGPLNPKLPEHRRQLPRTLRSDIVVAKDVCRNLPKFKYGGVNVRQHFVGCQHFVSIPSRHCWCLLFVLIRHGFRGGSGPQRWIRALGKETGNPIMAFHRPSFFPSVERAPHCTTTENPLLGGDPLP